MRMWGWGGVCAVVPIQRSSCRGANKQNETHRLAARITVVTEPSGTSHRVHAQTARNRMMIYIATVTVRGGWSLTVSEAVLVPPCFIAQSMSSRPGRARARGARDRLTGQKVRNQPGAGFSNRKTPCGTIVELMWN